MPAEIWKDREVAKAFPGRLSNHGALLWAFPADELSRRFCAPRTRAKSIRRQIE